MSYIKILSNNCDKNKEMYNAISYIGRIYGKKQMIKTSIN